MIMPSAFFQLWLAIVLVLGVAPTALYASFGFQLDGTLDKPAISKAYFESDFERIVLPLETWRQGIADNKTREDSIFAFKYLSVIYAANAATREKSKSFMFQLLTLAPTIEIIDMYASDEIERIFRSVKQEIKERKAYISTHDSLGYEKPKPDAQTTTIGNSKKSFPSTWMWWAAGGVGLVVVAGATYFLGEPDHETTKTFIPVWQGKNPQ
jgi:hypothetical protein